MASVGNTPGDSDDRSRASGVGRREGHGPGLGGEGVPDEAADQKAASGFQNPHL